MIKVHEHQHSLKLIDLQVSDQYVEESDEEEEEKDLATQDELVCVCDRCDEEINGYYRYHYECIDELCDYYLHKFCAELPTNLEFSSYPHPLILVYSPTKWTCTCCQSKHERGEVSYTCLDIDCSFKIDVKCVVDPNKKRIHHPSHPHPLVPLISKPILYECNACGKEHKGIFFLCTTCPNFAIHTDCAFVPKSLLIQQTTNDIFYHTHPLTLSYSFPKEEREAKYHPTCRICHGVFHPDYNLWIYKCDKCIYYAHMDCTISRREPFMSILSTGPRVKNFEEADYPDLFHLPFPNQTCSAPKQLFSKEIGPTYECNEVNLQHTHHEHELTFVNTKCIDEASSSKINFSVMCHNPMKRIELLCNGCVKPIMEVPFYMCGANENYSCNFALHEWCTRLPTKVEKHPGHPQHTLVLMPNVPGVFFNIFDCDVCHLPCNGYAYGCVECEYYVDVTCGLMPKNITHEAHQNHILKVKKIPIRHACIMCQGSSNSYSRLGFSCSICDVYMHVECALFMPKTITHPFDKHPMKLSYLPIENHKSEYFCEICEYKLNPHFCFYHCDMCAQSVHSACAPLILCCETETYSFRRHSRIYRFLNVKFGSIHKIHGHPHPLLFSQGIKSDGQCSMCSKNLVYMMIFKCFKCEFAVDYICCGQLNNS